MARPKKARKVCSLPVTTAFMAVKSVVHEKNAVIMSVDEYETIRLIDLLEMTQEECSVRMDIARTTVQAIYMSARQKVAMCIVEGKQLLIEGGDVKICGGTDKTCTNKNCNC